MTEKEIKDKVLNETTETSDTTKCDCSDEKTECSCEDEISKLKTEVEDWKNSYLRKQAEFQNFTKRKEKEFDDFKSYASEKVIVKVLDIIDNLDRAILSSSESKDFDSLVKGVELTLSQMKNIISSEGVEVIVTEKATFDPHLHMAVSTEESADFENDEIISEFQKGYRMKGKVIRPSMVKVCKK